VVADGSHRRRLGSTLAELLAARARGLGIRRFTATIAADNESAHSSCAG
jgi:L-amino acid N-acyltransferase YncA